MYQEASPWCSQRLLPLFFLHLTSKVRIDMTSLDAAIARIRQGFSPVPIPHRSKRPVLQGLERLEITIDAAPEHFNDKPQNIGPLEP